MAVIWNTSGKNAPFELETLPRNYDRGLIVVIASYFQVWNKKHNIINGRVISSHMYIGTYYITMYIGTLYITMGSMYIGTHYITMYIETPYI